MQQGCKTFILDEHSVKLRNLLLTCWLISLLAFFSWWYYTAVWAITDDTFETGTCLILS